MSDERDTATLLAVVQAADTTDADRATAREILVRRHMYLVEHISRRYADRGEPLEDLVQVGSIGLLKAIDRYDPDKGAQLSSYASPTIAGEIKRHFRDRGWTLKVPRGLQERGIRVRQSRDELTHRLNRSPTPAEIASSIGSTEDEVLEAMEASSAYSTMSLEGPTGDSDDTRNLGDSMGENDLGLALVENRETLRPALEQLDERQRRIIVMRFFGNRTQTQIAAELGISQVHVSRLLTRALAQLRTALADAS